MITYWAINNWAEVMSPIPLSINNWAEVMSSIPLLQLIIKHTHIPNFKFFKTYHANVIFIWFRLSKPMNKNKCHIISK